ncbi:MAG: biotin--[acetyl-CoA-carboxylase] ligase [Armatimonadota bacterium]|nr:biotin--[acetyl-CoA-carboxylase] ligase [Armatimonadota bacterium]MDR7401336.1 biotin--[acetyl-CoA-carboxylase] ligase [Armatimonadota bacterium]MDR7404464.1 biotin--[acetyl-CoA-carboxylase] ligase [Armatimonadota bacterium]MDR7437485.1 biotin--[acetyl-CoA-carboxylase] ligase [Armatimonadota bacterium]MDR7472350.1 biotin--[acetyl-CoA-carboxylase] ligase [Armatimonadota bacterium]
MADLTEAAVAARLRTRRFGRPVVVLDRVGSTNDRAREMADAGAPEGTAVIARVQTAGRGRRGRRWLSPPGGLWMSVVLRPGLPVAQWPLVGFAVALATADAAAATAGVRAALKWPNDVVVGDSKLAGVLVEAAGSAAVAGVGVNANLDVDALPAEVRQDATSLRSLTGSDVDLALLAADVLSRCEEYYDLLHQDPAAVVAAWRRRSATLGRRVRTGGAREVEGVAEDVDDTGALVIRTAAGRVRVVAGEVSLRPAPAAREERPWLRSPTYRE